MIPCCYWLEEKNIIQMDIISHHLTRDFASHSPSDVRMVMAVWQHILRGISNMIDSLDTFSTTHTPPSRLHHWLSCYAE